MGEAGGAEGGWAVSDKEMRVAIAEACGYKPCEQSAPPYGEFYEKILWQKDGAALTRFIDLPDYLSDLNAMHEAEMTLSTEQLAEMDVILDKQERGYITAHHATARQRAIAFCRLLNLDTTDASTVAPRSGGVH